MDDGDGGGSRFYRPPASGEATARERGWGDGQAAVGRRSVWMNVSVHSSTELGSVGARLSAAPLFSSASAPVRHFSIWRITRSLLAGGFVSVDFPSLRAGPGGSLAGRRHGHIRCRLGFQVVRMRRADGRTEQRWPLGESGSSPGHRSHLNPRLSWRPWAPQQEALLAYHANIHPSSLVLSMEAHGRATRRTAHPTRPASLQAGSGGAPQGAAVSNRGPRSIRGERPPPWFGRGRGRPRHTTHTPPVRGRSVSGIQSTHTPPSRGWSVSNV